MRRYGGYAGSAQVCTGMHGRALVFLCLGAAFIKNVFKSWFLVPKLRRYFVQITFEIFISKTINVSMAKET